MRRRLLLLLWAALGVVVGLVAEQVAFGWFDMRRWIPDLAVGWSFIGCGLLAVWWRPRSRTGVLITATGFAWFLGNLAAADVAPLAWIGAQTTYLHRGLLIHSVLSFPTGRLRSRSDTVMVALGYVVSIVVPAARDDVVTIGVGVLVIAVSAGARPTAHPAARRAHILRMRAATAVGSVLVGGGAARLLWPDGGANGVVLLGYQAVLCAVAFGLLLGLTRVRAEAVTDLVVELAQGGRSATLQEALAHALGDPTLQLAYRVSEADEYVDAQGRPVDVGAAGADRATTPITVGGRPVGVLLHDGAVLQDPRLLASISAAAELAAANARLQAEVRTQIDAVHASRRRLVEAADEERRRLQHRLRTGAQLRLQTVAEALSHAVTRSGAADLDATQRARLQLLRAQADLDELAQGLQPQALEELGLAAALHEIADACHVPVEVVVAAASPLVPELAAAAYFACSESLANITKHACATHAAVTVVASGDRLLVEIVDDGIGGADISAGSGLRGVADRIEALGGVVALSSPPGEGTRLTAEIPLGGETQGGRFNRSS